MYLSAKKLGTMDRYFTITFSTFLLFLLLTFATPVLAGSPPPPPPGHGTTGNVPGGGAPIGEGLFILVAMGAAYGFKKWKSKDKE